MHHIIQDHVWMLLIVYSEFFVLFNRFCASTTSKILTFNADFSKNDFPSYGFVIVLLHGTPAGRTLNLYWFF